MVNFQYQTVRSLIIFIFFIINGFHTFKDLGSASSCLGMLRCTVLVNHDPICRY